LRLRGTVSESVRAPNISDLFAGAGETFASVADVCAGVTATSQNTGLPNSADNCRSIPQIANRIATGLGNTDNLPGAFTLTQVETQSTGGRVGGSVTVQEETAESFTIGAVINVPKIEGLVIAIDWYDIEIDDAIATTSRTNIVRRCYDAAAASFDPTCGGLVLRDVSGALVSVDSGASNENQIETAGMDIDVQYNTELAQINDNLRGNLNMSLLYTYIDEYDTIGILSGQVTDSQGEIEQPEHRWNLTSTYSIDDLAVVWRMRYWDEVKDSNTPGTSTFGFDSLGFGPSINEKDAVFYHDLSAAYDVTEQVNVYFGINNVLDEDPEILAQGSNYGSPGINTNGNAYDVIGRRYYAGIRVDL
ncbi:MAG: iron complex outermembrane receptor protein, partial [Patiriisocius sp.]